MLSDDPAPVTVEHNEIRGRAQHLRDDAIAHALGVALWVTDAARGLRRWV